MDHGVLCGVGDLSDIERSPWRLAGGSSLLLVNTIYFCRASNEETASRSSIKADGVVVFATGAC